MSDESGFPIAPSRAAFGPRPRNMYENFDPETDMGADTADLLFWTAAGAGHVARKAWCVFDTDGTLLFAAENWDPDGAFAPTVEKTGTGVYVVTYPALVPDRNASDQALAFLAARATPQTLSRVEARALVQASGVIIDVETFAVDAGGTASAADARVFLELT